MLSFFPRGVLDEILNLIELVSEVYSSYFCTYFLFLDTKQKSNAVSFTGGHNTTTPITSGHKDKRNRM